METNVEWIQKVASDRDNWKTIARHVMSEVDDYIPLYMYNCTCIYIYLIPL